MSLYDALMIGVSGLNANSRAMSVFSSNIANVNTVGYKSSQSAFETMLGSAAGGSAGLSSGVMASAQANIAQQGAEFATSSATDLAINGNGFFCVTTNADKAGQMLFTRAGSFAPDAKGDLRNSAGLYLLGYPLGSNGAPTNTTLGPISLSDLGGKGQATTTMSLDANLDASADINTDYDISDPTKTMYSHNITPDFQTTLNVYDSQGGVQPLQVSYVKTGANTWAYEVAYTGDNTNISPPGGPDSNPIASGTVTFDSDGNLKDVWPTGAASDPQSGKFDLTIPWQPSSGLQPQTISSVFGTVGKTDGLSQFASESVLNNSNVDGAVFGNVTGVNIGPDGTVYANYSNGLTQAAFKIPLATFANADGLNLVGGNAFAQSGQSGTPRINTAQTAGSGAIQAYALEGSTVDLATEFTNMITTQQAYSASARVVSTASQMLDQLMQMQH